MRNYEQKIELFLLSLLCLFYSDNCYLLRRKYQLKINNQKIPTLYQIVFRNLII